MICTGDVRSRDGHSKLIPFSQSDYLQPAFARSCGKKNAHPRRGFSLSSETLVVLVGVRDVRAAWVPYNPYAPSEREREREREREEMAGKERQVSALIRLVVNAGQAKVATAVSPALGQQHRLNLMAFCKDFNNARTQHMKKQPSTSWGKRLACLLSLSVCMQKEKTVNSFEQLS